MEVVSLRVEYLPKLTGTDDLLPRAEQGPKDGIFGKPDKVVAIISGELNATIVDVAFRKEKPPRGISSGMIKAGTRVATNKAREGADVVDIGVATIEAMMKKYNIYKE